MATETKLKPCPFCGGAPTLSYELPFDYVVRCSNRGPKCGATVSVNTDPKERAVSIWNTRVLDTANRDYWIRQGFYAARAYQYGTGEVQYKTPDDFIKTLEK